MMIYVMFVSTYLNKNLKNFILKNSTTMKLVFVLYEKCSHFSLLLLLWSGYKFLLYR